MHCLRNMPLINLPNCFDLKNNFTFDKKIGLVESNWQPFVLNRQFFIFFKAN